MASKYLKSCILSTSFIAMGILFISIDKVEPLPAAKSPTSHLEKYSDFKQEGNIRRFIGETLQIDVRFLLFDKAATAQVGLYGKKWCTTFNIKS